MGKRTKIVCTLGPATEDDEVLRAMLRAGMNVARLNFSHGSHEYHRANIERVRRVAAELGLRVAIMTDTKGPEIRTRLNVGGSPVRLATGEVVRVTTRDVRTEPGLVAIDYERLAAEVAPGDVIYINDGLIALEVARVAGGDELECVVANGGLVGERKGVNVPTVKVSLPSITAQDREDIRFSCEMGVDAIAASFVRDAATVAEIRALCAEFGAPGVQVFSKIESAFAVERFDEILAASDGIMVARGDLGVEITPSDVPQVQRTILAACNEACVPVITATQMLESMTTQPRPTRAEVTDVANAIREGTDCVMLSGETAAGAYPVEAVRTMAEICEKTEAYLDERREYAGAAGARDVSETCGHLAVEAARYVGAKALVCPTRSGRTARVMSSFRPRLPIIMASPVEATLRRACFYWGVEAVLSQEREFVTQVCFNALRRAKDAGLLAAGDMVVVTAGDPLTAPVVSAASASDVPSNLLIIAEVA